MQIKIVALSVVKVATFVVVSYVEETCKNISDSVCSFDFLETIIHIKKLQNVKGRGTFGSHPADIFGLEFLIGFRCCRKLAPIIGKIIGYPEFAVEKETSIK